MKICILFVFATLLAASTGNKISLPLSLSIRIASRLSVDVFLFEEEDRDE